MNIELRRYRIRPETIDGQIWIDGQKVCDCAEHGTHHLHADTYKILLCKCKQHGRKMPLVTHGAFFDPDTGENTLCGLCKKLPYVGNNTSMPNDCSMICPGNGVYNRTDGAILVGKYLAPGCLSHPKSAFDNLYDRIRKNAERGNEITLTIINKPLQTSHL